MKELLEREQILNTQSIFDLPEALSVLCGNFILGGEQPIEGDHFAGQGSRRSPRPKIRGSKQKNLFQSQLHHRNRNHLDLLKKIIELNEFLYF